MASPSEPILLRAILALQSALQGISKAGGYHYDVKATSVALEPVALQTIPTSELPYFIVGLVEEGLSLTARSYQGARYVKDVWSFPLVARVDADGADPLRKIRAGINLIADVEKAVHVDLSLGNLVIDTRLEPLANETTVTFGNQNQVYVKQLVSVRLNPRPLGQMG